MYFGNDQLLANADISRNYTFREIALIRAYIFKNNKTMLIT